MSNSSYYQHNTQAANNTTFNANLNNNYNEPNIYQPSPQYNTTHPVQFHANHPHQQLHANEPNTRQQVEMSYQIRPHPPPFIQPDRQPFGGGRHQGPQYMNIAQNQGPNQRMPYHGGVPIFDNAYAPRQMIQIQPPPQPQPQQQQVPLLQPNHTQQHGPQTQLQPQQQPPHVPQIPHQPPPPPTQQQYQVYTNQDQTQVYQQIPQPHPQYVQQGAFIHNPYAPQGQAWQPPIQMGQQPIMQVPPNARYQLPPPDQAPYQVGPPQMGVGPIPPQQTQAQMQPQVATQQLPQQNTLKKREKKILAIVDPHTNEVINLNKETPATTTATSSSSSTVTATTTTTTATAATTTTLTSTTATTTTNANSQSSTSIGANTTDNQTKKGHNIPNQTTPSTSSNTTTTTTVPAAATTTTAGTAQTATTTSTTQQQQQQPSINETTTDNSTANKRKDIAQEFSLKVLGTLNPTSTTTPSTTTITSTQPPAQSETSKQQSTTTTTTHKSTPEQQQPQSTTPAHETTPPSTTTESTTTTTIQTQQAPRTGTAKEVPKTAISTGKNPTPTPSTTVTKQQEHQQTPPPPQPSSQKQQENETKEESKQNKEKEEKQDETTTTTTTTTNKTNTTTTTTQQPTTTTTTTSSNEPIQVSLNLTLNSEDPADNPTTTTTTTTTTDQSSNTMKERNSLDPSTWTPEQQDAKKRYNRDFLMSMQDKPTAVVKPKDLPVIPNVILDDMKPKLTPQTSYSSDRGSQYGGKQSYHKGSHDGSRRGPPHMNRNNSVTGGGRGGGGGGGSHMYIELPKQQDIKINRVENPYKIHINDPQLDETEKILRSVRAILNKLTPQNFKKLAADLIKLEVNIQEDRLKATIDIIFDKAIDEPKFSQTYAELCHLLSTMKLATTASADSRPINFRSLLLTRCQKEFDNDYHKEINYDELLKGVEECTDEKKKAELTEELEEKLGKAKRRSLGNIRFIGELFKLGMLNEGIMHHCIRRLLEQESDEENLECLCKLLATIGKSIDTKEQEKTMNEHFGRLQKLVEKSRQSKTPIISARIRFAILDVMDLRSNKWVPRRQDNAPRTIDEIRREAEEEEIQKQIEIEKIKQADAAKRAQGGGGGGGGQRGSMRGGYQQPGKSTSMDAESAQRFQNKPQINVAKQIEGMKQITKMTMSGGETMSFRPSSFNKPQPRADATTTGGGGASSGGGGGFGQNKQMDSGFNKTPHSKLQVSEGPDRRSSMPSHSSMTGGVKKPYMQQHSNEGRDKNIEKVKQMNRQSSKSEISSESSSRDASLSRNDCSRDERSNTPAEQVKVPPRVARTYTADEVERKSNVLIEEFLLNDDVNESLKDFEDFNPVDVEQLHEFVRNIVQQVLERSETARTQTGKLFYQALKEKKLTISAFVAALKTIFEGAEDTAIDVPHIADYLGEIIAPLIQPEFDVSFIRQICEPIIEQEICANLVSHMLHKASNRLGHTSVLKMFNSSNVNLTDFFRGVDNLQEYLKEKQLEWIAIKRERTQSQSISSESYENTLFDILKDSKIENEDIFDQIENNFTEIECKSKQFVRALMGGVCRSCLTENNTRIDPEMFKKRGPILSKYVERNDELELESLYAVQALDHKLQHPSGFIRVIFDMLYDEDIISEEAFRTWQNTPRDDGHAISVLSLKAFFDWLDETEASEN